MVHSWNCVTDNDGGAIILMITLEDSSMAANNKCAAALHSLCLCVICHCSNALCIFASFTASDRSMGSVYIENLTSNGPFASIGVYVS